MFFQNWCVIIWRQTTQKAEKFTFGLWTEFWKYLEIFPNRKWVLGYGASKSEKFLPNQQRWNPHTKPNNGVDSVKQTTLTNNPYYSTTLKINCLWVRLRRRRRLHRRLRLRLRVASFLVPWIIFVICNKFVNKIKYFQLNITKTFRPYVLKICLKCVSLVF